MTIWRQPDHDQVFLAYGLPWIQEAEVYVPPPLLGIYGVVMPAEAAGLIFRSVDIRPGRKGDVWRPDPYLQVFSAKVYATTEVVPLDDSQLGARWLKQNLWWPTPTIQQTFNGLPASLLPETLGPPLDTEFQSAWRVTQNVWWPTPTVPQFFRQPGAGMSALFMPTPPPPDPAPIFHRWRIRDGGKRGIFRHEPPLQTFGGLTADQVYAPPEVGDQVLGFGAVESPWWAPHEPASHHQPHLSALAALSEVPPVVSDTVYTKPDVAVTALWQAPSYESIYRPRNDPLAGILYQPPPPDVSQLPPLPPIAFKWYEKDRTAPYVPRLSTLATLIAPPPPKPPHGKPPKPGKPPHSIINWRDFVIRTAGESWGEPETAYEWSNNRKFDDSKGPYGDDEED